MWLSAVRYPHHTIIVCAANMHIARNLAAVRDLRGPEFQAALDRYETMGEVLRGNVGARYVSIATTALGGEVGRLPSVPLRKIDDASPDSLEARALATAKGPTFVALKAQPARARFFGLVDFQASWSEVFDGAVVFRAVTPATSEAR